MCDQSEFSLKIDDMTIQGVVYGDVTKPPILALHGWLDNAASFELLAAQLDSRHVIAIDFIGHGKSSHRPLHTPYYIWDNITDVYLVMQALSLEKIDLLGHSMGASIAMLFAASFPEKVNKLFLIDGVAPLDYPEDELPSIMAQSIRQKVKHSKRYAKLSNKAYPNLQSMIDARREGRFPVSEHASRLLVQRGSKVIEGEYHWSSDSALLLPSINRMSTAQIHAFLQAVKAPVYAYLGTQGLNKEQWQVCFDSLAEVEIKHIEGNHHLHLQTVGAVEIASAIDNVNMSTMQVI